MINLNSKLINTEFYVKRIVRLPLHNYLSSTEVNYNYLYRSFDYK